MRVGKEMTFKLKASSLLIAILSANTYAEDKNTNRMESFQSASVSIGSSTSVDAVSETKSLNPLVANKNITINTDAIATISRRLNDDERTSKRVLTTDQKQELVYRPDSPEKSLNIDGFSFYSANSYLNFDLDGDGYFSDFTIEFDADYDGGYADVYAVLYYSKNGGPWIEYFETDVFEIHLDDASDDYQVSSRLVTDFPTSDYDILIDLYEAGVTGIVSTISADDTNNLYALPLEDEEHELNSNASQITYVASTISHDVDGDQFYTDLTIEYDISTVYSGDVVYAEVILTNSDELWSQTLTTDNFVLGNQTEFIDLVLNTGYTAGWYDVQVNLVNSYTGEIIANAAQDFSSLAALRLESVDNDNQYNSPTSTGGGVNSGAASYESGGGAVSGYFFFLFFLILLYIRDIQNKTQAATRLKSKLEAKNSQ